MKGYEAHFATPI